MKRIKHLLIIMLAALAAKTANAQTPQLINYQAVARNSIGNIIASQPISIRLTIHDGSAAGTVQYQETHSLTTNAYGLFTMQIGGGATVSGNINAVTWSTGTKFLQVEMDPAGGSTYTDMGTEQLVTVPYAFYTANAGSAASLTGNVTMGGDVTGTNSAATVAKLQGKNISATAPATGQVLQWSGTAWTPTAITGSGTVTSITAGAGLSGGTITTSGTISLPNVGTAGTYGSATQVPVITTDAEGRVSGVTNTTITGDNWGTQVAHTDPTLAGSGTTGTPLKIAQQGATTGQALEWNGTTWLPATITGGTSYTAGTGINIAGTVISAQNTTALWNAGELEGNTISATTPATGQGLVWSGTTWAPATLPGTTYTSGTGITIAGSVVNAQTTSALWNANELQGNNVSATAPTTGQGLVWSGTNWAPATLPGTTYTSGTGITIAGSIVNGQTASALWNANELQGNNVSATTPTTGQGLVWSGSAWAPATLPGSSYTAGTGINIVGTTISGQNTTALWNSNELQGKNISVTAPATGQGLVWSGSAWTPTTLAGTTYTAGTGINIVGSTISGQNTTALWNANELQGNNVSATTPTTGQILSWSGTAWTPATASGTGTVTSVTAGTGLSGGTITTSGTISLPNVGAAGTYGSATQVPVITTDAQGRVSSVTNTAITGDNWGSQVVAHDVTLTGNGTSLSNLGAANTTALWNANELEGKAISVTAPTTGQGLVWSGAAWTPTTLAGTTYTAGTGINIVGSTISGQNTTALWNANELQGNNVSATAPTTGQVLTWSGTAWTPTTASGTGTVTAITAGAGLSGGTITTSGTISMPNVGAAGTYGSATQVPVITTDAQGRVTTITNTSITGDNWGSQVVQTDATLAGSGTSGIKLKLAQQGATTGQVLTWNGTTWLPATSVSSGWNLTGNAGTNSATNFVGTTDGQPLRLRVNNTWSGEINNSTFNTSFGYQSVGPNITTGTDNTGVGNQALALTTTGSDNTAIGFNALYSNTTAPNNVAVGALALQDNTTGGGNTAVGYYTLTANTTGFGNVAVGENALSSNTTGQQNTANGAGSLQSNTTANNNVGNGYYTLYSNTTGANNSATGFNALYANTTGASNVAEGYEALYSNTSGADNTASGAQALYHNTTATGNTADGYYSLYNNTTGASNTGIGYYSLYANSTGSFNTANGYQSLLQNTTGTNNAATGYNSLNNNTTGSDNVANGSGALYANTTGANNTANGYAALNANTTGGNNTATGTSALQSNTTGTNNTGNGSSALSVNSTGSYNTANGYGALAFNTTGSYNSANGASSLAFNTTGSNNTAAGYFAMYSNTSGAYNVANGYSALYSNSTGSNNIATGLNSLYSNTTGYSNIAIGTGAFNKNTTSTNTVAIGDSALYSEVAVAGLSSVAVGSKALYFNTTGTANVANGYQSLYSNTTGINNCGTGYQTLYSNTTGGGNIADGYQALNHNTTGGNNSAFGESALSSNTTGSNDVGVGVSCYPSSGILSNWNGFGYAAGGGFSTSNSVELGNTSIATIRAEVTGITAISDRRIKDNVKENVPGLDFINRLRPVTYNLNIHRQNEIIYKDKKEINKDWEGKYDIEKKTMSGFIAQEVDQAAKDAGYDFCGVERPSTPDGLYGVRYTDFIMPLVKSVQELNMLNDAQKKTIEAQDKKIDDLQKQLSELMNRVQAIEKK